MLSPFWILLDFVGFVANNFNKHLNQSLECYHAVRKLIAALETKAVQVLLGDNNNCSFRHPYNGDHMSGHDFLRLFANMKKKLVFKDELTGFVPEVPDDPDKVEKLIPVTVIDALLPVPPLPNLVVLGQGGTFLTGGKKFDGYTWQPCFCIQDKHSNNWSPAKGVTGKSQAQFYAVPWDSEVARLNGHKNPLTTAELLHGPL